MSENNQTKRSGVLRSIATVLNSCGSAVVITYDTGAKALGKVVGAVKHFPILPEKAKGLVTGGLGVIKPKETDKLHRKIKEYEAQVRSLYYEIGKTSSKLTDANENLQDSEIARELLSRVKEYESNISDLKNRIVELEEAKKAEARRREQEERYRRATIKANMARPETVRKDKRKAQAAINAAIKDALIHGDFESASDRAIFDKIATDILDKETEIKMLAAAELGKMRNKAAVPVLQAAIGLGDDNLSSEIINSLITIGDKSSVKVFLQSAIDDHHRVRVASLRGLYKLAPEDKDIRSTFIDALRDGHPEVRKTAATLIGWLDEPDAVPSMVQCLTDEDEKVRKAIISALANLRDKACVLPLIRRLGDESIEVREKALDAIRVITGEDISLNTSASGEALAKSLEDLKKWWQQERITADGRTFIENNGNGPVAAAAEEETAPAQETVAEAGDETDDKGVLEVTDEEEEVELDEEEETEEESGDEEAEEEKPADSQEGVN